MQTSHTHKKEYSFRIEERKPGDWVLFVFGRIALEDFNYFLSDARGILAGKDPRKLEINLAGVTSLDSVGSLALKQLEEEYRSLSVPVTFQDVNDQIKGILELINREDNRPQSTNSPGKKPNLLERIGEAALRFRHDFVETQSFAGEIIIALVSSLLNPRSIRWRDLLFYMKVAGVDGLPIVGLISFLMGLIMAFMASLQLKLFGANIYVASLLALAMVKELGPIMTAILVAGRSGSAFAAEIATMIVNDEVNALKVMGFDPTRFLAVPKVLATMLVLPILTIFADLFAILGGLLVGVIGLDLTANSYLQQTRLSIDVFDIVSSLMKSVIFAALIAAIGCQRGFQAIGGAESVGTATTSAVVSAIFLIIVTDSTFAIILHYIR